MLIVFSQHFAGVSFANEIVKINISFCFGKILCGFLKLAHYLSSVDFYWGQLQPSPNTRRRWQRTYSLSPRPQHEKWTAIHFFHFIIFIWSIYVKMMKKITLSETKQIKFQSSAPAQLSISILHTQIMYSSRHAEISLMCIFALVFNVLKNSWKLIIRRFYIFRKLLFPNQIKFGARVRDSERCDKEMKLKRPIAAAASSKGNRNIVQMPKWRKEL